MKKINRTALIAVIAVCLIKVALSLSFVSLPNIDNTTAETGQSLVCYWNASNDAIGSANVSWYNSSTLMSSSQSLISQSINPSSIKRNEVWTCEVIVTNGTAILSENKTITIRNGDPDNLKMYNSSNKVFLGENYTIYEDTQYNFYLNATDPDSDTIKYGYPSYAPLPNGSNLNINGSFNWLPSTDNDAGVHNITFLASDYPYDGSKLLNFILNVIAVNDAPVFSPALSDKQAIEDIYFEYNISATDEENNFPLRFEIVNDNGIGLTIQNLSNTSAKIYFTPEFADAGNYIITLRINDSSNASTQGQFNLEVISTNHAPNITYLENVSANQSQPFLLHLNASDIDTDDNITFSISSICSGLWSIYQLNFSANNSYGIINVTSLTNEHVRCRNVTIRITDNHGAYTALELTLSINNTNDAPIIYENSSYAVNSKNNTNVYNLTAYQYSEFHYRINFTDIDILTYQGDSVFISTTFDNFSITLNSATGEINFTTNYAGNYGIYIEANDSSGASANKTLNLTVIENSIPSIYQIQNFTINESELFNFTINASDADIGQNINYYTNASTELFNIDNITGNILFTPNQSQIGNYSIDAWVIDSVGAVNHTYFNIEIINKNDAPVLSSFSDFNNTPIVANHAFYYDFDATDRDLLLPVEYSYDSLTFWANTTVFTINSTTGEIWFTPSELVVGNYSILIGVNDSLDASNTSILTFIIYNTSQPPQIINITPYGPPPTNFGWANTSDFPGYTTINVSENSTVIFNHTTINSESGETLIYSWLVNGIEKSSDYSYAHNFDFFSSRIVNITLLINDSHYSSANFSWIVNVTNVNRPVVFLNNPNNQSITGTTIVSFLELKDEDGTFYNPDDDLDSNGKVDCNETNNLNFSYTFISGLANALNIGFEESECNEDIGKIINGRFTALNTGQAVYRFTASDGESNATTQDVFFNITKSAGDEDTRTITRRRNVNVYYQIEVDKIISLNIIAPESIIIYENNTIAIPIILKNLGNITILGINLTAYTNNSEVKMSFDKSYFKQLPPKSEENAILTVKSYRAQGRYEIDVTANARTPSFTDSATILVNSIESNEETSEEKAKTRISFAMDLLSSNPKCLELNEALNDVRKDLSDRKFDDAQKKVEEIIKACRYLTSEKELLLEKPNIFYVSMKKIKNDPALFYTLTALLAVSIASIGYSMYYTNKRV